MIYGVTGMWGANKLGIIKYRIKNVKIFLIAIIWLFILDVYLADYRSMAMTLGLKDSFAILPHVQNDFYIFYSAVIKGIYHLYFNGIKPTGDYSSYKQSGHRCTCRIADPHCGVCRRLDIQYDKET